MGARQIQRRVLSESIPCLEDKELGQRFGVAIIDDRRPFQPTNDNVDEMKIAIASGRQLIAERYNDLLDASLVRVRSNVWTVVGPEFDVRDQKVGQHLLD